MEETYFFPVMPKESNYLSGTMGEVRSTHFHAGIDIKTGGRSGLPVYATKEGHVSRIRVAAGGYGHALYILHPDGETSVYCHLLKFREDITKYVLEQQYKNQSFEVNLFPPKELFEVNKGDLIAFSGNTGSSLGPHLHFEIRDENQRPINPLKKGFKEISDDIPPIVYAFALKSLDIKSRVQHEFGRFEFDVRENGNDYFSEDTIEVYGKLGLQVKAYDKLNGAVNRNGIPYIAVFLDERKIFSVQIDSFSFSDTRHVVAYYDYHARRNNNGTFQKLYLDDGNPLPFFPIAEDKGTISILDEKVHVIRVEFRDVYGNSSRLNLTLKGSVPKTWIMDNGMQTTEQIQTDLFEKYLRVTAPLSGNEPRSCLLYSNRMRYDLKPAYYAENVAVYLWDMNLGIPDSVQVGDLSKILNYKVMLPSGVDFNYYNRVFNVRTFRKTLYDTLFLETDYSIHPDLQREIFTIGDPTVALANPLSITFKPRLKYPGIEKYAVYSTTDFKNFSFTGNKWNEGQITISTKNLGNFIILSDTLGPSIRPLQVNRGKVSFRVKDDLSGIKEIDAYLNEEWLLMHYDPKQNYIWSEPLIPNNPLKGAFKLVVKDNAGNIQEYTTQIN